MPTGAGETGESPSGWTVDTLHVHIQTQLTDLRTLLDERDRAQKAAVEAAFQAQRTAMETAFMAADRAVRAALAAADKAVDARSSAAEREFHEHLEQVRHETSVAFEASDKAINKAEAATERRFEGVNEFRAQLSDQAARFMPRQEAEAALNRDAERITELAAVVGQMISRNEIQALITQGEAKGQVYLDRITELERRVTRSEGRGAGLNAGWVYLLAAIAALGTIFTLYLALSGPAVVP